jgi:hypothetical protein
MKVKVYFNLKKKMLSVQTKVNGVWKVTQHAEQVFLNNATFYVSQAGRQRVLKNKRKNVHAYIIGELVDGPDKFHNYTSINYNPYKLERFHDGEKYIDNSDFAFVYGRRIYAVNPR